jgi:UDP-N-acetylenolpyruvoylglucosamine reductase
MTISEALAASVRGRVTMSGDERWDDARRAWNLSVDQRPDAVVEATGSEDVQAVVRFARQEGLRVAPQATGHGAEALGPLEGAILLKTSAMRGVAVDPDARTVRVQAGARAGDVAEAAGAHGLAPVLGLASTVGVVGLALGGGTGWLSRAHGLTANTVRAFEVVTADGERRRVDAENEPELFWAMRGGGGRFAIVTEAEFEAHRANELQAGSVIWPAERAPEILERFRQWASEVPESVGAVFRYLDLPSLDAVPPPLRGRRVVAVIAASLEGGIEPPRASNGAIIDTFGPIEPAALVRVAGDPEDPGPARGDGFLIEDLTEGVVDTVAELIAENTLAPLGVLELRLLGGAMARRSDGDGALAALNGRFSVFAGGPAFNPEAGAAIAGRLDELRRRLAQWTTPQALLNASGGGIDPALAFEDGTWQRLRLIQDQFDPDRLILSNHA